MPEPILNEPSPITKQALAIAMMHKLKGTLSQIDADQIRYHHTNLAKICNWNGLLTSLHQDEAYELFPQSIKIGPQPEFEKDGDVKKLIRLKPFLALALISSIKGTMKEIRPDYLQRLPELNGLEHQLRSLLIGSGFKPKRFDTALTKVTVGL